jgi:hypothetical protein
MSQSLSGGARPKCVSFMSTCTCMLHSPLDRAQWYSLGAPIEPTAFWLHHGCSVRNIRSLDLPRRTLPTLLIEKDIF